MNKVVWHIKRDGTPFRLYIGDLCPILKATIVIKREGGTVIEIMKPMLFDGELIHIGSDY